MNRADLQQLSQDRIEDVAALLAAQRWSAAYYLAGYVVECALKACVAKQVNQHDFPDKNFAIRVFTHNSADLLRAIGLLTILDTDRTTPGREAFNINWEIVKMWQPEARYQQKSRAEAEAMYKAVADPQDGLFAWIQAHW